MTIVALLASGALQPGHRAPAPAGWQGSPLLAAFFGYGHPSDRLTLSLQDVSKETRGEIERRLARGKTFRSGMPVVRTNDPIDQTLADKRVALERAAATMLVGRSVPAEAARYAVRHPVSYEWEGDDGGPLREAAFAARYLREHPESPVRPFLAVLLLHLYRCAFEAASWNGHAANKKLAADGYRAAWNRAMQSPDPVIRAVATDIDAEALLYIGGQGHPRTWNRR